MYLGTHVGATPIIKIIVTYIPLIGGVLYILKDFKNVRRKILQ
jgi:hypothetical protein